ncbi:YlxM family DNA-binding protein [Paenibacillus sp. HB172176]|uniref:YlxM family DNA-binding protein n=1 Tax=Paenibacillus sp. HB172176 TaxID=2493690 RepID=UPI00143BD5E2|nr:YlxM family DNA-binding protein [Paenibacillus sp. HB172176]
MTIEPDALTRTTRANLLFDFYESLLTEKQRMIFSYYYHDDYSLGEIAAELGITRQAVHDNMKRVESTLESYESKLELLVKHERLVGLARQLEKRVEHLNIEEEQKQSLLGVIAELQATEQSADEGGEDSWQHLKA